MVELLPLLDLNGREEGAVMEPQRREVWRGVALRGSLRKPETGDL